MLREILVKEKDLTIKELSGFIDAANTYQVDTLCFPSYFLKYGKDTNLSIAAQIDFPYGLSCEKIRLEEAKYAADLGCEYIDVTINPFLVENKLFTDINRELKAIYKLGESSRKKIRAIIEYRLSELVLVDLCDVIKDSGIDTVITSSGTMLDDPSDNILMTKIIMDNVGLSCIIANNVRSPEIYEIMKKEKIFGIRACSNSVISEIFGVLTKG